jgi:hypothetical protein
VEPELWVAQVDWGSQEIQDLLVLVSLVLRVLPVELVVLEELEQLL